MRFDLRRPCGNCPYRSDIVPFLTLARARELARDLSGRGRGAPQMGAGLTFTCHKTIRKLGGKPPEQHCAGALVMLAKAGVLWENQMLRIAAGLRLFDARGLDLSSPVYASPEEFVRANERMARRLRSRSAPR